MFTLNLLEKQNFKEWFEEGKRRYLAPNGKVYTSITTILGEMTDKSGLDDWKRRVGEEEAKKIASSAANRGKKVHDMIEKLLKGIDDPTEGHNLINIELFKNIRPYVEKNIGSVYGIEFPLYSKVLKCAGRSDLIAEWDNELAIIDIKTSTNAKKEEWITNYFQQETAYSCCLYEMYKLKAKKIVTLITCQYDHPQIFINKTEDYLNQTINIFNRYNKKYGR